MCVLLDTSAYEVLEVFASVITGKRYCSYPPSTSEGKIGHKRIWLKTPGDVAQVDFAIAHRHRHASSFTTDRASAVAALPLILLS